MTPRSDAAALLLDFDGTLVDLAPTPDAVRVDPALPALLERLRTRLGGALAIVTGRPIADIDAFLPGVGLDVCGLHGIDRRIAGRRRPLDLPPLDAEIAALRDEIAGLDGILIEDKGIGVAIHWRLAPHHEAAARAAIDRLAAELGAAYRVQDGKSVREIVSAEAGKGAAVRALMDVPPYAGRRPVFAGDDRTDESAFAATTDLGGLAFKIGTGETIATRRMPSPEAFLALLADWADGGPIFADT